MAETTGMANGFYSSPKRQLMKGQSGTDHDRFHDRYWTLGVAAKKMAHLPTCLSFDAQSGA